MSVNVALPSVAWSDLGSILTFVVPAPDGCDLACPFCYVRQRGEDRAETLLSPDDYGRFVREAAEQGPVAAVCIQGYEPLLDASFPYTQAILGAGRWLGLPTSLITNGTHLDRRVDQLRVLAPARISVSLDAASPAAHDRQRGKQGAWAATVRGLEAAVSGLAPGTELAVTSVLVPKRRAQLEGFPALLRTLGVKRWVVTALQRVGKDAIGGPVGARARIIDDLERLQAEAERHDITFVVDDEFDALAGEGSPNLRRIQRLVRPDGVYRLAPNGQCSKGTELLRHLSAQTARWRPGEVHAGAFLRGL